MLRFEYTSGFACSCLHRHFDGNVILPVRQPSFCIQIIEKKKQNLSKKVTYTTVTFYSSKGLSLKSVQGNLWCYHHVIVIRRILSN